jgi:hypothetical protein
MFPVERALLIINRTAGTGHGEGIAEKLTLLFKESLFGVSQVLVKLVSDHAETRACTAGFISESEAPAFVVAGGGGGTLRAVIGGICDAQPSAALPGPEDVRVGCLRMGSGNVLAKQFGVPHDPLLGLRGLITNFKAGTTVPCCVMRCEIWNSSGHSVVHHAVTLGGLGQFGRIPADLARWHTRFPTFHKNAAQALGIEKCTNVEYALTLLIRSVYCMLFPGSMEMVQTELQGRRERLQLLSGIVMNFPIKALPFKPLLRVEDEAIFVYLIPFRGRFSPMLQLLAPQRLLAQTRCIRLERNQCLEIKLIDRDCVEFFLDEDPLTTYGRVSFGAAGSIAFVPGSEYQAIAIRGVSA